MFGKNVFIKGFLSLSLFLAIFVFTACKEEKSETRLYLKESLLYSVEQDERLIDSAQFAPLEKPSELHTLLDSSSGFVWLKYTFMLPQELKGKNLAFFAGRINMADVTYLNGFEIGRAGVAPPGNEFSAWNESRAYSLPSSILNEDGENTLLIKVWTHAEGAVPPTAFIGESSDVKAMNLTERLLNSIIPLMCALCMAVIGLYELVLFLFRRKDRENFFFAILNIVAALYLSVWYIQEIVPLEFIAFKFLTFQKIMSDFMVFVLVSILVEFVNSYVHRKEKWYMMLVRYILVIIPSILIFIQKDYTALKGIRDIVHIFMLPPIIYIIFIIVRSVIKKREGAISLIVGFSPFILCLGFDLIPRSLIKVENFPFLSTYSWMIVIMSFLLILARRFAKSRNEVEYLNKNLEKEVADRTRELSESNEHLESANATLAEINRRAERDMALAVNVQRNFYPKAAPKVKGWDIAYVFNPMAGVSGDLYDFFYEGNELKGCCLFDVSGHGIASGLVTMLAKTVIVREFEKGKDEKVSKIMKNISQSIGEDKGNIENYLTGVLLRINDNYVEYVNGAHPAMLCRSKSGKVMPALIGKDSSGGSLVGIADLPAEYSGINFNVKSGDSLMLYTDCLYESRNEAGQEFGAENVARIFEKVGNGSASEQLENLLNSFKEYTGSVPLNDDLTILVLKKL
ncbi:MAG: SpoIIE family protein phosphatase [Treponemataceae bacterium]|nr:SpoIIE family protein phosphatase [Treponemataceae bacterium]